MILNLCEILDNWKENQQSWNFEALFSFFLYNIVMPIFLPLFSFMGIFGNFLSIIIFMKWKQNESTARIYYIAMAVADINTIISYAFQKWIGFFAKLLTKGKMNIMLESISNPFCKMVRFVWHSNGLISDWILIIYAFERLLSISFPFLRNRMITTGKAKINCFLIAIIAFIIYLPIFFTGIYELKDGNCFFDINNLNITVGIWFWSVWLLQSPVPPVILVILNLILLKKLIAHFAQRKDIVSKALSTRAIDSSEVKAVIDLIVLSAINFIFSMPTIIWGYIYYNEGNCDQINMFQISL